MIKFLLSCWKTLDTRTVVLDGCSEPLEVETFHLMLNYRELLNDFAYCPLSALSRSQEQIWTTGAWSKKASVFQRLC